MATNSTEEPEKDIVSFDQAIELCIIGYNEPTFCMYEIENRQLCLCHLDEDGLYMPDKDLHAPTKSQVFRWFREKYEIYGIVGYYGKSQWSIEILNYKGNELLQIEDDFNTYEEAENVCIDKLIEIAKQQ